MIELNYTELIDCLIETINIHQPGDLMSSPCISSRSCLAPAFSNTWGWGCCRWGPHPILAIAAAGVGIDAEILELSLNDPQLPEAYSATHFCHCPTRYATYAWTLSHLEQHQVTFLVTSCTLKVKCQHISAQCPLPSTPALGRTEVPDTLYFVELVHVLSSRDQSHAARLVHAVFEESINDNKSL